MCLIRASAAKRGQVRTHYVHESGQRYSICVRRVSAALRRGNQTGRAFKIPSGARRVAAPGKGVTHGNVGKSQRPVEIKSAARGALGIRKAAGFGLKDRFKKVKVRVFRVFFQRGRQFHSRLCQQALIG